MKYRPGGRWVDGISITVHPWPLVAVRSHMYAIGFWTTVKALSSFLARLLVSLTSHCEPFVVQRGRV